MESSEYLIIILLGICLFFICMCLQLQYTH